MEGGVEYLDGGLVGANTSRAAGGARRQLSGFRPGLVWVNEIGTRFDDLHRP
jgi:hypothetical protein